MSERNSAPRPRLAASVGPSTYDQKDATEGTRRRQSE